MELSKTNINARNAAAEIAEVATHLWKKGWAEGNAGNISLNVTEQYGGIHLDFRTYPMIALRKNHKNIAGNYIFLTIKGSRMRDLATDPANNLCLVKISQAGDAYQLLFEEKSNPNQPSSEILSHLEIHNMIAGKECGKAIVHTHPHEVVALSHSKELKDEKKLNEVLLRMHTETAFFIPKGMGFIPFQVPGSQEMATSTLKKLEEYNIVLWEKHGCMAIGDDVHQAFDRVDMMAKASTIYLTCRSAGIVPEGMTDEQINQIVNSKE
jgi:rhamnulose-1-phosphate aldolase